jgi:hypothetical protein
MDKVELREALRMSARLHARRREWQTAQTHAEVLLALATEHGFARYMALGAYLRGRALAAQGQGEEGIAQMRQAWDASRATGARIGMELYTLAETYGQVGQVDEGLHVVVETMVLVSTRGGDQVYEGLTDEEIREIEALALDRRHFMRQEP